MYASDKTRIDSTRNLIKGLPPEAFCTSPNYLAAVDKGLSALGLDPFEYIL